MPPSCTVRRFADPRDFLARTGAWLLEREAEHTLLLGVVSRLIGAAGPSPTPAYLAAVEGTAGVLGCAIRRPPWPLLVTGLAAEAVYPLAEDVGRADPELPAVIGPERSSEAFARLWAARRGVRAVVDMRQRLFRLDRLVTPPRAAPGRLRAAGAGDLDTLATWLEAFSDEAGIRVPDPAQAAEDLVARGTAVLWEDAGRPRSLAAIAAETPHTARIAYVYTPPEGRRSGYATACVAALTSRLLDRGLEAVVLFTDLANPTSNALYPRLGYRPVLDVTHWRLVGYEGEPEPTTARAEPA